eukprot:5859508-Alexandrium_andersonii.AAC.2
MGSPTLGATWTDEAVNKELKATATAAHRQVQLDRVVRLADWRSGEGRCPQSPQQSTSMLNPPIQCPAKIKGRAHSNITMALSCRYISAPTCVEPAFTSRMAY